MRSHEREHATRSNKLEPGSTELVGTQHDLTRDILVKRPIDDDVSQQRPKNYPNHHQLNQDEFYSTPRAKSEKNGTVAV